MMICSVGGELVLLPWLLSLVLHSQCRKLSPHAGEEASEVHSGCVCVLVAQMEQTPSLQGIASCADSGNSIPSCSAELTPIPHELILGRDFSTEKVTRVGRHVQRPSI